MPCYSLQCLTAPPASPAVSIPTRTDPFHTVLSSFRLFYKQAVFKHFYESKGNSPAWYKTTPCCMVAHLRREERGANWDGSRLAGTGRSRIVSKINGKGCKTASTGQLVPEPRLRRGPRPTQSLSSHSVECELMKH